MIKITLTVDPDQGEQLFGLLAKAYGRRELGIAEFRIEQGDVIPQAIPKLTVKAERLPRNTVGLGGRAFKHDKPNGVIVALSALKAGLSLEGVRDMWIKAGFNKNGVGATLSKLAARRYIKRLHEGVWRLLPAGEELLHAWENRNGGTKVERHDSTDGE